MNQPQQQQPKFFMVPEALANAVSNYLSKCPWSDVNVLLQALGNCQMATTQSKQPMIQTESPPQPDGAE